MLSSLLFAILLGTAPAPIAAAPTDSTPIAAPVAAPVAGPRVEPVGVVPLRYVVAVADTTKAAADTGRPHAIEYSDWYGRRLTIHRWGSYAMIPLFAWQYYLGDKLTKARDRGESISSSTKNMHGLAAGGVAVLFGVNTLTGGWNLYESRNDPNGRTLRMVHGITMLLADAGFVATGAMAESAGEDEGGDGGTGGERGTNAHRNVAVASMGLSVLSTAIMWFGQRD